MTKRKFKNKLSVIVLLVICLFTFISSFSIEFTKAEETIYTNVLEDLQKDENFKIEAYPVNEKDYSLQVIQIAESVNKELFVYVYQPCLPNEDLKATSISISTGINDNASWKLYNLKLLNSNGVFYKYLVEDFRVKEDALRYYDITEIFRKWNKNYNDSTGNDNEINEVSFEVGKLWTASTVNNQISYSCLETETIKITDKYVDFIRYTNGFSWFADRTDSHYIAFSTDKPMEKLLEIDIEYVSEPMAAIYHAIGGYKYVSQGNSETKPVTFTNNDNGSNKPYWLGSQSYNWKRIEKVTDFINTSENNLKDEVKNEIKHKQWIVRFAETTMDYYGTSVDYYYTNVSEVTILRLKFETDGVVYNLGVVDNKQSGDNIPGNKPDDPWEKIKEILKYIFIAIVALIVVVVLSIFTPVFQLLFKGIFLLIKYLSIAIWWLITAPFSLLK